MLELVERHELGTDARAPVALGHVLDERLVGRAALAAVPEELPLLDGADAVEERAWIDDGLAEDRRELARDHRARVARVADVSRRVPRATRVARDLPAGLAAVDLGNRGQGPFDVLGDARALVHGAPSIHAFGPRRQSPGAAPLRFERAELRFPLVPDVSASSARSVSPSLSALSARSCAYPTCPRSPLQARGAALLSFLPASSARSCAYPRTTAFSASSARSCAETSLFAASRAA